MFHYGWIVAAACGVMLFSGIGLTVNSFSVFLSPLIETAGLTKTQGSSITSFQSLGGIATMLFCGVLFDRFGARYVSGAAGLLISAGFVVFAYADSFHARCLAAFLTGVGYAAGTMIPVSILITSWFKEKRGIALGLATAGSGIATIIFPPLLARVIARNGIASGFLCNAASIAVLTLIAFLMIRDLPSQKGLSPYGQKEDELGYAAGNETPAIPFARILFTKKFLLTATALTLLGGTIVSFLLHFSTFYTSEGLTPEFAAMMMSTYGLVMLGSKPLYGWILDRFGVIRSNTYIFSLLLAAMISGLFIGDSLLFAYLFTLLVGLGVPVGTMGLPIWAGALFGKSTMAGMFSAFKFCYSLGGLMGTVLPGYVADVTGRYANVFYVYIVFIVILYGVIQFVFLADRRMST